MKIFKLSAILCAFVLFGCSPKYYVPNSHQVTMFTEQGDVNLNLNGDGNQFEVQAAYAMTDQFAASANFSRFAPNDMDNGDGGSGYLFEVSPGYYKPFGDGFIFETYVTLGFGSVENHFPSRIDSTNQIQEISANAFRIGVQPSLSVEFDRFSFGFSTRLSSLNYSSINGKLDFGGLDQIAYLNDNKGNVLIEPALTARFGTPMIKGQAQYGFSYNASNSDFLQSRQYLSVGLNINLNMGELNF